jgi:hypothetical protein
MKEIIIRVEQMRLGDRVRLYPRPLHCFTDMVVKQINEGDVTFFRPYVHTTDFSFQRGVICYVGIEEYTVRINDTNEYELLERVSLR